jgi:signal transduction histidine kinase
VSTRRFSLFQRRVGRDVRVWPILALLLLVVLVGVVCVLWFMGEAMRNERMAVREQLAEAYRGQLSLVQTHVAEWWKQLRVRLDGLGPGALGFARCVREGLADSAVIFDDQGHVVYPSDGVQSRSADANAELRALESSTNNFQEIAGNLRDRLNDYESGALPSAQRRFLMHELRRLDLDIAFPTLAAEELAARYLERNPPDVWSVISPKGHVRALFAIASLHGKLNRQVSELPLPKGVSIAVIAPGDEATNGTPLVAMLLGPELPGWRLALSIDDSTLLDTEVAKRVKLLVLVACLVIAVMSALSLLIARSFGRQVELARLKNDLVANVSHELKTPLTAMRALVDTLLDTEKFDEKTTREYLKLLATETARLSRLIENFLTFSRLERNKSNFEFARVQPEQIVEGAVAAFGERAHKAGCVFESRVAMGLPSIQADPDALVTAVLNLLDNAWKYSGDKKQIVLRAEANNGYVCFSVEDNGIGLSPGESKRIFHRFYQADQRLARTAGGCGLGLSIVQSIVEAHHGSVHVKSEPGHGSTFIIEIPAVQEGIL